MRKQTPMLMLVLSALLLSSVGALVALASTPGTAHACSIAGPWAEASQTQNLEPGQQITIAGYGFSDLIWHDNPTPQPPDEPQIALCDFDLIPMQNITIVWHGDTTQVLGAVSGPDFKTSVTVPVNAGQGKARIDVGGYDLWVSVLDGQPVPPDPCPLVVRPDGTAHHWCPIPDPPAPEPWPEPWPEPFPEPEPEPWPCPMYAADSAAATQPGPDVDVAPGYLPPCPEPCVDYLHTTDDGTTYDYKWDCPDPCSYPQADPGAKTDSLSVWCPPPDPCPMSAHAGGEQLLGCPDPCWPAPATPGEAQFLGCPDPCLPQPNAPARVQTDCPEPCYWVGGDALVCPEPASTATTSTTTLDESDPPSVEPQAEVAAPVPTAAEPAASEAAEPAVFEVARPEPTASDATASEVTAPSDTRRVPAPTIDFEEAFVADVIQSPSVDSEAPAAVLTKRVMRSVSSVFAALFG